MLSDCYNHMPVLGMANLVLSDTLQKLLIRGWIDTFGFAASYFSKYKFELYKVYLMIIIKHIILQIMDL